MEEAFLLCMNGQNIQIAHIEKMVLGSQSIPKDIMRKAVQYSNVNYTTDCSYHLILCCLGQQGECILTEYSRGAVIKNDDARLLPAFSF